MISKHNQEKDPPNSLVAKKAKTTPRLMLTRVHFSPKGRTRNWRHRENMPHSPSKESRQSVCTTSAQNSFYRICPLHRLSTSLGRLLIVGEIYNVSGALVIAVANSQEKEQRWCPSTPGGYPTAVFAGEMTLVGGEPTRLEETGRRFEGPHRRWRRSDVPVDGQPTAV